jgi:Fur family ferric uptake transcriptional regulator
MAQVGAMVFLRAARAALRSRLMPKRTDNRPTTGEPLVRVGAGAGAARGSERAATAADANADGREVERAPVVAAFVPLCAVFRRFLKSRDLKYTQERADVLDAIIARDGAFEAEELLLDLRARGHDVSKATVYRSIRLLLDAGIITQSLFDAKQSHYELIYGREPRDFMVCMKTGRRIEFRSNELTELRNRICTELGWKPVGHRFQIFAIAP